MCLVLLAVLLTAEHLGIATETTEASPPLAREEWAAAATQSEETCLVLNNYEDGTQQECVDQMESVLQGMRVGFKSMDITALDAAELYHYQTLVVTFTSLDQLEGRLNEMLTWVESGGRLMFMLPPDLGSEYHELRECLGILEASPRTVVEEFSVSPDFMIGAEDRVFTIGHPYDSTIDVVLDEHCSVYMQSKPEGIPLLWERSYGEGKFVVNNHGMASKQVRGMYSAAYSLLDDVCVYPVINASCFFIDDFPSPVPAGSSEQIEKDYGRSIASFYANVWWPDILSLAEQYGVRYSGMVIENYSDVTGGPLERNMNYSDFRYYGNMLINSGGELGYHGYNHLPLYTDAEYGEDYKIYRNWDSAEDMTAAMQELIDFAAEVFPDAEMVSYVPPSNLMSSEGYSVVTSFENIRIIAGLYFGSAVDDSEEDLVYEQEFSVTDEGIVELPRVVSGFELTDFMELAAFSELNFHFVNNHFMHPDDTFSDDRSGGNSWESMRASYAGYMEWLYSSAPSIRNATVSEAAIAVEQYDSLVVHRTWKGDTLCLSLDGFNEEAYLFVRFNAGELPRSIEGASIEQVTDTLYLLHATQAEVAIGFEETQ